MKKFVLLIMCCLFILGTQAQQQNFSRKAIVVNKEQKEESKSNLDKTNVKQERMQFKQNKIGKFLTYSSVKQTLNAAKSVGAVVENFEGSTFPPTSWTILDQDGDGYNWVQSGTVAASPTTGNGGTGKCAMSASYINNIGALTPNNWLITPQVAITAGTAFTFYVSPYGYADHYQVMVSTTDLQPSSFTSIFQETLPATAENFVQKNLTTQLAPYIGENVYIAFVHNSNDEYWMLLDDVAIYDQTACPGANFSNESALVAGNDIDLTWNIDNAPDNYIINVNGINVETNLAGSATSYQIPNSPDGLFEVEITAVFDGCPPVSTTIEDIEIGTPCIWTAALHDDGGDGYGWDGGILAVVQNNFITYYTSMINAEDSIVDIPIYNTTAQFIYVAGGSGWFSYDDENTFTIYDSNDIEVFVSETCDNYDSYEIVYTTDAIPCAAPATNDATITAITSPVTGMNLTATETVIATIKNVGTDAITSMQLGLTVDGGTEVIEPYTGNIVSMATANYTFSATADLSAESSHTITVRAILASDANTANDSKTVTVTNYPIEGTDCANAISYTINTPETTTTMNPMVRETWYAVTVDQNYMNAHFATCPS
ncbi:MAG: choice-of-anchor J domain-containing protein, partial [Bacteroidales bacterium]|nr:choice-of-anchor J domain-containing protein [Bacteroidales bacterium]